MVKVLSLFIFLILLAGGCGQASEKTFQVTRVIDGDTFVIQGGVKVRMIGIDTPETVKFNTPVQPFGKEASNYTKKLLTGKPVRLVYDVQPKDRYGRELAYVYLQDGTFVNALLLKAGYARIMTIPPNVNHADEFVKLQQQAREANKGLWGAPLTPEGNYYVGSSRSDKFHYTSCTWAKKISPANLVKFQSKNEAAQKGYQPCKVCKP